MIDVNDSAGVSPQVTPDHYKNIEYDSYERWASYWHQINLVRQLAPSNVLEIGTGNGLFSWYLRKQLGLRVVTCDIDKSLGCDLVGDVRTLSSLSPPNSFDFVCAFQVLEHLPFEDFAGCLTEMGTVASKYIAISLPCSGSQLDIRLRVRGRSYSFTKCVSRNQTWRFDGQHYWQVGARGYSKRRVRDLISREFNIVREFAVPGNAYHRMYVMSKRDK